MAPRQILRAAPESDSQKWYHKSIEFLKYALSCLCCFARAAVDMAGREANQPGAPAAAAIVGGAMRAAEVVMDGALEDLDNRERNIPADHPDITAVADNLEYASDKFLLISSAVAKYMAHLMLKQAGDEHMNGVVDMTIDVIRNRLESLADRGISLLEQAAVDIREGRDEVAIENMLRGAGLSRLMDIDKAAYIFFAPDRVESDITSANRSALPVIEEGNEDDEKEDEELTSVASGSDFEINAPEPRYPNPIIDFLAQAYNASVEYLQDPSSENSRSSPGSPPPAADSPASIHQYVVNETDAHSQTESVELVECGGNYVGVYLAS